MANAVGKGSWLACLVAGANVCMAARQDLGIPFDTAWNQALAAMRRQEFTIVDEFQSMGIIRAERELTDTNWVTCNEGRGSFVKTVIETKITFGKRASGQLAIDVQVSGNATWYYAPTGYGSSRTSYLLMPCTSTGELEKLILTDITDPLLPLDSVTQ